MIHPEWGKPTSDFRGKRRGRGRNATPLTALGVVGASEDAGGPRLVGGRLVALRQHLPALAAPPPLQLQAYTRAHSKSDQENPTQKQQRETKSRDSRKSWRRDLRDGDGLVELAGADVLGGGGVLVPGQLHVARRVARLLRHRARSRRPLSSSPLLTSPLLSSRLASWVWAAGRCATPTKATVGYES